MLIHYIYIYISPFLLSFSQPYAHNLYSPSFPFFHPLPLSAFRRLIARNARTAFLSSWPSFHAPLRKKKRKRNTNLRSNNNFFFFFFLTRRRQTVSRNPRLAHRSTRIPVGRSEAPLGRKLDDEQRPDVGTPRSSPSRTRTKASN